MEKKRQRKLNNLRYRLRKNGYLIYDEVKVVVLPGMEEERSLLREREIKKFGYDLQERLFK